MANSEKFNKKIFLAKLDDLVRKLSHFLNEQETIKEELANLIKSYEVASKKDLDESIKYGDMPILEALMPSPKFQKVILENNLDLLSHLYNKSWTDVMALRFMDIDTLREICSLLKAKGINLPS